MRSLNPKSFILSISNNGSITYFFAAYACSRNINDLSRLLYSIKGFANIISISCIYNLLYSYYSASFLLCYYRQGGKLNNYKRLAYKVYIASNTKELAITYSTAYFIVFVLLFIIVLFIFVFFLIKYKS
jgi:hypothetical protein